MIRLSRRTFISTTVGGVIAASLSKPAISQSVKGTGSVVVYDGGGAWGEAKRIAYFEPFEKETGIKIVRQPAGTVGSLRAGIIAGKPAYDVANISGSAIPALAKEGLLLPIDYGSFNQADRDAFKPVPTDKFCVPALFYSLIIAYDAGKFGDKGPVNWADVWNLAGFPGGRSLATGAWGADGGIFEAALLADGVAPKDIYPFDWDRVFKSLDRIRGDVVKYWESGAEAVQLIADQQVSVGSAWNGRVSNAVEQGIKLGSSWEQGILQWDGWAVPKGAANSENAMKFIAFASRADRQTVFAQNILYGPTNSRAFDTIPADRAKLLPTNPTLRDKQIVQDYAFWNAAQDGQEANYRRAVVEWEKWLAGAR